LRLKLETRNLGERAIYIIRIGEEMNSAKNLIAKADGFRLGLEYGKTMAEVDAYYEGLLKEIEELEKIADSNLVNSSKGKGGNHGKKSGQEDNQKS